MEPHNTFSKKYNKENLNRIFFRIAIDEKKQPAQILNSILLMFKVVISISLFINAFENSYDEIFHITVNSSWLVS